MSGDMGFGVDDVGARSLPKSGLLGGAQHEVVHSGEKGGLGARNGCRQTP